MHKRLYNFLELCNILYPNQFGFLDRHSTNHALISITETIESTVDNWRYRCGVFIEIQKTFDTVDHSILLKKLEHYGIRDLQGTYIMTSLFEVLHLNVLGTLFSPTKKAINAINF